MNAFLLLEPDYALNVQYKMILKHHWLRFEIWT